jgi:hypothetical protein
VRFEMSRVSAWRAACLLCVFSALGPEALAGQERLSSREAGDQEAREPLEAPAGTFRHELRIHEGVEAFRGGALRSATLSADPPGVILRCPPRKEDPAGEYESPVLKASFPFNEALPSWNVDAPQGAGFEVELRVGRSRDGFWSPYLYAGDWGAETKASGKTVRFEGGHIDVDYFRSSESFDRIQYRVKALPAAGGKNREGGARPRELRVVRFSLCLSDVTGVPPSRAPRSESPPDPPAGTWQRRLPVPYRSQRAEDPAIAGRICSPTSVAMVLAYHGVHRPTAEVAARAFDPAHDIYGNWPRNVQAAYSFGVGGCVARFSQWSEVKRSIAEGQPLIISVKAAPGELSGAPYPSTDGHLMVLVGFDAAGDVLVNDPAAATPEKGQRAYLRREMEKVWLDRGGTAYLLRK